MVLIPAPTSIGTKIPDKSVTLLRVRPTDPSVAEVFKHGLSADDEEVPTLGQDWFR